MRAPKPVAGTTPPKERLPVVTEEPPPKQFAFSFRYFREERYFGLGRVPSSWFVEWLHKLQELSGKTYDSIMSNIREKNQWRIHPINWSARNMPVSKTALNWIDRRYINNSEEYPFYQFQVTTALGRVIGFWDERGIFNVVFLDTAHNMQPSAYTDYRLRETTIAKGEYAAAISLFESRIEQCGTQCGCRQIYAQIQTALTHNLPFETVLIPMTADLFTRATSCVQQGLANSLGEIVQLGLDYLES